MENGVLVGYFLIDVKVKLYDGLYYDVDLFEMVFKIVVLLVFKEVVKKCDLVILELMMKVIIEMFEEYMGDIMGDVIFCCGCVDGMEFCGNV